MIEILKDKIKLIVVSFIAAALAYLFWSSLGQAAFYIFPAIVLITYIIELWAKKYKK
ncbi:hypothetical protein VQ7734_04925 [Vibrio quintilis]|uniref:Uncharacterized protein n=1 Tax=Vibrio quintilis TaxID=1117707 RepID=A0A1M7Z2G3_9VIBR|nr:hypothetical protein VQ7734_04925 [Vibrio quintilis]